MLDQEEVFGRLVAIAEFLLQAPIPEPTRQLLAQVLAYGGPMPFTLWLNAFDAVQAEPDSDKRLILREQMQGEWADRLRGNPHPVAQMLVQIYDRVNEPIAPGNPPLTTEAADAVLDIYEFQTSVVRDVAVPVSQEQRSLWREHLAGRYPTLAPGVQQWIAAAPLTAPTMRAGWKELSAARQKVERQGWATDLQQLSGLIGDIMKTPVRSSGRMPVLPQPGQMGSPQMAPPQMIPQQVRQMTPQQIAQNDQRVGVALQNIHRANTQAVGATARNFRF